MRYANIYIYIFVLHRGFFQQPRPRVGICKSRLEALTCKYMNIGPMLIRVGSGLLISSKTLTFEVMDTIVWGKFFYDKLQCTHTIRYRAIHLSIKDTRIEYH